MPNSRRKGANYELEIGAVLRDWASEALVDLKLKPADWFRRAPLSGGWSRTHAEGEDLLVPKTCAYSIECKKREAWTFSAFLRLVDAPNQVWGFWDEAAGRIDSSRPILLIFSQNREDDWVLMTLEQWCELLKVQIGVVNETTIFRDGVPFVLMTLSNFVENADPVKFMNSRVPPEEK